MPHSKLRQLPVGLSNYIEDARFRDRCALFENAYVEKDGKKQVITCCFLNPDLKIDCAFVSKEVYESGIRKYRECLKNHRG